MDNPARALATVLANNFMGLGPSLRECHWLHKAGNNPLSIRALNYATSLYNLATISVPTALLKWKEASLS